MSTAFDITVNVLGPLMATSLDASQLGADQHSDSFLAGTHVRGHLLAALKEFESLHPEVPEVLMLLGTASNTTDDAPIRAGLELPHLFKLAGDPAARSRAHRIQVKDGAIVSRALLVMDALGTSGQTLQFVGTATLMHVPEMGAERVRFWLERALAYTPAVGALKGVGFGRVHGARVAIGQTAKSRAKVSAQSSRLQLTFQLDRPFCFAKASPSKQNRFSSLDYVPGAALLGALIGYLQSIKDAPDIEFDQLRASHAVPCINGTSILPRPASLIAGAQRGDALRYLYDAALCAEPVLPFGQAPAFATDWKEDPPAATSVYPRPSFVSVLLVRTAISANSGAAKDGSLFAVDALDPKSTIFCAQLDWPRVLTDEDRKWLEAHLPNALRRLGKTKAAATNIALEDLPAATQFNFAENDLVVMRLLSDALLPIDEHDVPATSCGTELRDRYGSIFASYGISLQHHFAAQRYAGGNYLWKRYLKLRGPYRPALLTEAGAVFVFKVTEPKAANLHLNDWQATGLPFGDGEMDGDWRANPWRSHNGFGRVLVAAPNKQQQDLKKATQPFKSDRELTNSKWNSLAIQAAQVPK